MVQLEEPERSGESNLQAAPLLRVGFLYSTEASIIRLQLVANGVMQSLEEGEEEEKGK